MLSRQLARTGMYPNVVAFERRTGAPDSAGQPLPTWAPVLPLQRIPARIGPARFLAAFPDATHSVVMVGDYAAPTLGAVLLDENIALTTLRIRDSAGARYAILRLEVDAERRITRATCRIQPAGVAA